MDLKLDMYNHLDTLESLKIFETYPKFLTYLSCHQCQILRNFTVLCYSKCHKVCRKSSFSYRMWVLIGSLTLPSLKCNRLCVVELCCYNWWTKKCHFQYQAYLKWRSFSSTCYTSSIIMTFYQQILSMRRNKLANFRDDIISIDGVMTSQCIWHDVKIWWRHMSKLLWNFVNFFFFCSDHLYQFLKFS